MGKNNNSVITTLKVEGGPQARSEIRGMGDDLRAMIAVLNPGMNNMGSLAVRNSPIAPGAPPAPAPPSASASSPALSTNYPLNPAVNPYGLAFPGLLGAGAYAASSQSIIPAAPAPPGQRAIGPSLASGGFGGGSPLASSMLHINAQTITISAQTINIVGSIGTGGGDTSAGSGRGSSSFGGNTASGGGSSSSLIPPAPKPPGGGGGGGGGNGNPADIPDEEGPSSRFFKNLMKNPTPGGAMQAGMSELPIGGAAAITAAVYGMSVYGNAAFQGQRPQFETRLGQESGMLRGSYTPSALLSGQSEAAIIRGNMAFDRGLLSPFDHVLGGLPSLAYNMTSGQASEEQAMRAENEAYATQNIRRISALTGTPIDELRKRYGSRQVTSLGAFGDTRRAIGRTTNAGGAIGAVNNALDHITFGYFSAGANEGVHDFVFDPEKTKYMGVQDALTNMSLAGGANFDRSLLTNPAEVQKRLGKGIDLFGEQATIGSLGAVGRAMTGDPSQLGMYRAGSSFADMENIRRAAQVAASRGEDLTNFAPLFYQNGAMGEFGSLRDTRREMQLLQNKDSITGYSLSGAGSRYREKEASGADYKTLQDELRTQIEYLKQQRDTRTQEAKYAITDSDKAKYGSEINAISEAIASSIKKIADVQYQAQSTGLGAAGLSAGTAYNKVLYGGGDANALNAANDVQRGVSRQRAALLRQQSQRRDLDPFTRQMLAAQSEEQEQQAGILGARQNSQTTYNLDMSAAGLTGARAGQMSSMARLFGGPQEQAAAVRAEQDETSQQLKAVSDQIARGNLSLEELRKLQAQQISLTTRQTELQQEEIRGKVQAEYSLASGRAGIAGTEQQTAYTMGVGGTAGGTFALSTLNMQKAATAKAEQYVALLKQQGVSPDNPQMLQAQQQVASARSQEASLTIGLASTPYSVGLRRQEENASYQTDILSSLPGSYGNVKGSMRRQMKAYQSEAEELHSQYAQVAAQYGGAANIPEALRERFEQRDHQLGRSSAGLARQLAVGWESRLVSQSLGTGGNWNYMQNRFSSDRTAVLNGVRNPHFGATGADLRYFIHDANGDPGYGMSLAGSTGTPQGLARTALTGAAPRSDFSEGQGFPLYMTSGVTQGGGAGAGRGGGNDPLGVIRVEVTVKGDKDSGVLGKESRNVRVEKLSLGAQEDSANFFSQMMRGQ